MAVTFISEPIVPLEASFDTGGMAQGEPGLPRLFRWGKKKFAVAEVLETWKEHGDCRHGSGERYVRRHGYRVRTVDGTVMKLYFQRSMGRGKISCRTRWWIQSVENGAQAEPKARTNNA
jgi:phosphoribosylglycinamide formyltransferase-1